MNKNNFFSLKERENFPGGPAVKTVSNAKSRVSTSDQATKISHAAKKIKK